MSSLTEVVIYNVLKQQKVIPPDILTFITNYTTYHQKIRLLELAFSHGNSSQIHQLIKLTDPAVKLKHDWLGCIDLANTSANTSSQTVTKLRIALIELNQDIFEPYLLPLLHLENPNITEMLESVLSYHQVILKYDTIHNLLTLAPTSCNQLIHRWVLKFVYGGAMLPPLDQIESLIVIIVKQPNCVYVNLLKELLTYIYYQELVLQHDHTYSYNLIPYLTVILLQTSSDDLLIAKILAYYKSNCFGFWFDSVVWLNMIQTCCITLNRPAVAEALVRY